MRRVFVGLIALVVLLSVAGLALLYILSVPQVAPAGVGSREEALEIALSTVINADDYPDLEIFAMDQPLSPGQTVETVWDDTVQGPKLLTTITEDTWLLFVDEDPTSLFEHPVEFILVHQDDGEVETFQAGFWPLIDGEERWLTSDSREVSGEKVFSKITSRRPIAPVTRGSLLRPAQTIPSYCDQKKDIQKWALLVVAGSDLYLYPSIMEGVGQHLQNSGYNTQVLKPANLHQTFDTIQAKLNQIRIWITRPQDGGYCDEFLLIWQGHASPGGRLFIRDPFHSLQIIRGSQLAQAVDRTTQNIEGMQVRVVLDVCHAGLHIAHFRSAMPPDPNIKDPSEIVRDVSIVASVKAGQGARGDFITDSFTTKLRACIQSQGGADISALYDCARGRYESSAKTPQRQSWWNDGS